MSIHSKIGTTLLDHGNTGINVQYRTSQLLADAHTHRLISQLPHTGRPNRLRVHIGGMMIALGAAIAGTKHDLQERQSTMPPPFRKPGFVPTR